MAQKNRKKSNAVQPKKVAQKASNFARWGAIALCVVLVGAGAAYFFTSTSDDTPNKVRAKREFSSYELGYPNMCTGIGQMALVFAEGPAAGKTIPIAQALVARGLKGSFFPVAKLINDVATITAVEYIAQSNQFLGMRFATDKNPTTMSSEELKAQLCWDLQKIYKHTGRYPKYIMLPAGQVDQKTDALVRAMGMQPITWNLDSLDYATVSAGSCAGITASFFRSWDQLPAGWGKWIALLHDIYDCSASVLPDLLNSAASYNYTIVPMDTCLNDKTPYLASSTVDAFCGSVPVTAATTTASSSANTGSPVSSESTSSAGGAATQAATVSTGATSSPGTSSSTVKTSGAISLHVNKYMVAAMVVVAIFALWF